MGHRANHVLKDSDGYRLFYSHWGANVVERDLFWGPEEAVRFIESQRETSEWLDDVWCEGGAVLDFPSQTLLFFGGEDLFYDPFLHQAVVTLFRLSWSPWNVEWAYQGILDLARAVGVADHLVLSGQDRHQNTKPTLSSSQKSMCNSVVQLDGRRYSLVEQGDEGPAL